jgi:hypothetical protein
MVRHSMEALAGTRSQKRNEAGPECQPPYSSLRVKLLGSGITDHYLGVGN